MDRFAVSRLIALAAAALVVAAACSGGDDAGPAAGAADAQGDDRPPAVEGWSTDWSRSTVPLSDLIRGIASRDPRDVIPPIDDPQLETVPEASGWLVDREPVVLLELEGEARAYPLRLLTSHEIVNDEVAGRPLAVTYCPLCNSAVTFGREFDGRVLRFGVSGLLRNSDLVMWDRQTESLWQQITGEAIVGELAGGQLEFIPSPLVTWGDFRARFPDGEVLSRDQGIYPPELYDRQPYQGYDTSTTPFLFSGQPDNRYPAMERVVGVRVGDTTKAYPFSEIDDERAVNDELAGMPIVVFYGAEDAASVLDTGNVETARGASLGLAYARSLGGRTLTFQAGADDTFEDVDTGSTWDLLGDAIDGPLAGERLTPLVHTNELWFAWAAFNPDADVYAAAPASGY